MLAVNVALMSLLLFGVLLLRGEPIGPLVPALLLIFLQLMVVTSFALLFSSVTNPILAAVWTFASYVVGHLSWSLRLLQEQLAEGLGRHMCEVLYWVLPNLDRMDIKREVVHGLALPDGYLAWSVVYGLAYTMAVLALACLAFGRKDFNK